MKTLRVLVVAAAVAAPVAPGLTDRLVIGNPCKPARVAPDATPEAVTALTLPTPAC
jgi:hypothetical protein